MITLFEYRDGDGDTLTVKATPSGRLYLEGSDGGEREIAFMLSTDTVDALIQALTDFRGTK